MKILLRALITWLSLLVFGLSITPTEKRLNVRHESDITWTAKEKTIISQVRKLFEAKNKVPIDARYHILYSKTGGKVFVQFVKGYDKETREIQLGGSCIVLLDDKHEPTKILAGF